MQTSPAAATSKPPARGETTEPRVRVETPREVKKTATAELSRIEAADAAAANARVLPTVSGVALTPVPAGPPLGLKYVILKKSGEDMVQVPADTVFHAGDRIRISVETNQPGYLYIVNQGSSGTWRPLFPSTEVEDGNNHVDGFREYLLPPKSRMVFDGTRGTEKLFLVFSREPEPNLERMIYSLTPEPVRDAAPRPDSRTKTLVAANNPGIDDFTVGSLRNTHSRDLVIEDVDEQTPGEKKEIAVYVVNPSGTPDSRVVADLPLVHQ